MPTRNPNIEFRSISPRGGDQRGAFEELSFLLFAREFRARGVPIRRNGTGGDAGLEGIIADADGQALIGVQAKFFVEKLGPTQWRDLDESIRTALADNAGDRTLKEIVVTLPRTLTQPQAAKWQACRTEWKQEARQLGYAKTEFVLWSESHLRDLLLTSANRGLLLHYFEHPNFDLPHCHERTRIAIAGLGDRYRPELHTATGAEDRLHAFLRSERARQQYLEVAREKLHDRWFLREPRPDWPAELHTAYARAEAAWQAVLARLGDGVSLPRSFSELAHNCSAAADALAELEPGIAALIPPRERRPGEEYGYPYSRSPNEEFLHGVERWGYALRSLASYLRENALADEPCLLFTGGPGTGKTHVLAEVCSQYAEQGGAVLFLEGAVFTSSEPAWTQVVRWAGLPASTPRDFLETFAALAASTGRPALLCLDALNETPDRNLWRTSLEAFAAEIRAVPGVKLIVSCRSDYAALTLSPTLAQHRAAGWAWAEHEGLGIEVFAAFPKYIAAYAVRWHGLPPLAREFQNPLFLRTFCEAYAGRAPEPGSLSLGAILHEYARRKAELIGHRIDCEPGCVLAAMRELADAMQAASALQIPDRAAREICVRQHPSDEASRSLYRALLSEGVLAEFPGSLDDFGAESCVRFTYERVWDYAVSLRLMPAGTAPSAEMVAQLRDPDWRSENAGVVGLLITRCAEEGHGELADLISPESPPNYDVIELFLESLPWRTQRSVSSRTEELFSDAIARGWLGHEYDHLVSLAPNPEHPWNAEWLHARLAAQPLAERDRTWTFWVNAQFLDLGEQAPLRELLSWAERAPLELLSDDHLLLLATALAWCASTTVPEARKRLASTLTRLVAGRLRVANRLVARFLPTDDPYVRERVLLATAGAAQHAQAGDAALGELARTVHTAIFSGAAIEPHILIRHYAGEVCAQAEAKGVLPPEITPQSFRPPFRSRWPRIWSEARYRREADAANRVKLFASVEPGPAPGYGDWGRYVMAGRVHHFQSRRLREVPADERSWFDARIARRYVVQRVFELGWDRTATDLSPAPDYIGRDRPIERLSKKYQWIALNEFLGLLSDHYHFHDFNGRVRPFISARQLDLSELLDPFVIDTPPEQAPTTWDFAPPQPPWWRGYLDPLPRPLASARQREVAQERASFSPSQLIELHDGAKAWLALSAFHVWYEPVPVWHGTHSATHVGMECAIQSYLVAPKDAARLIRALTQEGFTFNSRRWLEEPEFAQPLAALRTFPDGQEKLRKRCRVDAQWEIEGWRTGAFSTTCRCAADEEQRRAPSGLLPSPQLADFGNLRWLGRGFDFAPPGQREAAVRYFGRDYRGACVAQREALCEWVRAAGLQLVWRAYVFKYLLSERSGENHARDYWSTFTLRADGSLSCCGGATRSYPHGPGPKESLPWCSA